MRIDARIEEAVREAYRAVIAKDGDRMVRGLRGLSEDDFRTAVAYGAFVCGYVVNELFPEGLNEAELNRLAAMIIETESSWISLGSAEDIAKFLAATAKGDTTFAGVAKEDVIGHIFVCGGDLLASYRSRGQAWWDYLEEIENALEAAPEPTP